MGQLIAFRGLQGIGAGGLMAMAFAIIGDIVSPRERGRYTGYLGLGVRRRQRCRPAARRLLRRPPLVAVGLLHQPAHRRRRPLRHLERARPAVRAAPPPRSTTKAPPCCVAGMTALLLALVWGGNEYAWCSPAIVGLPAARRSSSPAPSWRGRTRAAEPIMPLGLFRLPVFRVSVAAQLPRRRGHVRRRSSSCRCSSRW